MTFSDDDQEARTERPTERRRREARERGLVARSAELVIASRTLTTWAVIGLWGMSFTISAAQLLQESFSRTAPERLKVAAMLPRANQVVFWSFAQASTPLVMATVAVLVAHFAQVGWLWQPNHAAPQSARLSPISSLARILSQATLGRGFTSLLKLLLLLAVCGRIIFDEWPHLAAITAGNLSERVALINSIAIRLVSSVAITALVWGIADYFIQRWQFERSLQMTKEELRQEAKEIEGDPHIRHQRRVVARQLATQRPMD